MENQQIMEVPEILPQTEDSKKYLSRDVFSLIQEVSGIIKVSGALPENLRNQPANIVLTLLTGYEMGMSVMRSIQGLYIVNGSVNVWGKEVIRRLREHGYIIQYIEEDEKHCTARVTKPEVKDVLGRMIAPKEEYTETFYFVDAVASGWTGMIWDEKKQDWTGNLKAGWRKGQNRKMKMRYGVISAIIKSYIPEVLGSANEIQEIYEEYKPEANQEIEIKPITEQKKVERKRVVTATLGEYLEMNHKQKDQVKDEDSVDLNEISA